jgi:hypothetical protein
LGQIVCEILSQKYLTQKGLVEWLKVKALSSTPLPPKKESVMTLRSSLGLSIKKAVIPFH